MFIFAAYLIYSFLCYRKRLSAKLENILTFGYNNIIKFQKKKLRITNTEKTLNEFRNMYPCVLKLG